MMTPADKERFMRRCLELAHQGWGNTHPNPMVGALIVEEGRIVAEGHHASAGQPHAEVVALQALGRAPAAGAVMFVTLEPCSTQGRTPPCTEAIIRSGLRHVVVGAIDPNPEHEGRGLEALRAAGVTVESRVLLEDCEDLNLVFNHWITRRQPLLAGKFATTIDGRIATRTGESKWITGSLARADVMRWRRYFPAIAVGANTALRDGPRLTARIDGAPEWCPVRFVFDGMLRTAMERDLPPLYTDDFKEYTVVLASERAGSGYARRIERAGANVWVLPAPEGRISFPAFREKCAAEGITGVYVEGGSFLLSELLQAKQIDYAFAYRAPVLLADLRAQAVVRGLRTERLEQAIRLERVRHASLGDDELMRGSVVYPGKLTPDENSPGYG